MNKHSHAKAARGFTLLEMVVVLGVTGLIFGGLWGLIASGNSQLQAQSVAQQYRQVIEAVRKDVSGDTYSDNATYPVNTPIFIPIGPRTDPTSLQGKGLLPPTFKTADAFGNSLAVVMEPRSVGSPPVRSYRWSVYSSNTNPVPDKVGAQIAALIGADGGFIFSQTTDGCTGAPVGELACGSYGSFSLDAVTNPGTFPTPAAAPSLAAGAGRIVTLSYSSDSLGNVGDVFLWRKTAPNKEQNTMQQDMFFDNAAAVGLHMQGKNINMNAGANAHGAAVNTGGGTLSMDGGTLDMAGGPMVKATSITADGALSIASGSPATLASIALTASNQIKFNAREIQVNIDTLNGLGVDIRGGPGGNHVLLNVQGYAVANNLTAGSFVYSSDASLKENIRPILSALDKVTQIRGVNFDWRKDHSADMGLLAQDVQKVFPEAVRELPSGKLGVDYARMVAPIIEALRELKKENTELREKLDKLSADGSKKKE